MHACVKRGKDMPMDSRGETMMIDKDREYERKKEDSYFEK